MWTLEVICVIFWADILGRDSDWPKGLRGSTGRVRCQTDQNLPSGGDSMEKWYCRWQLATCCLTRRTYGVLYLNSSTAGGALTWEGSACVWSIGLGACAYPLPFTEEGAAGE